MELLLLEGRAIDIQSKANLVSGQSFRAIFTPNGPRPLHPLIRKHSVIAKELLVPTSSAQFPKLCMSMALLHGSEIERVFLERSGLEQLRRVGLQFRERLVMVGMWPETGRVPSEQATQGQRDECRHQEVGDSVEVEWREGHQGDGQGEGEAGRQRQEFTVAEYYSVAVNKQDVHND